MTDHLTFHHAFSDQDFETEYNLRLARPDYEVTVLPGWEKGTEAARSNIPCELDIRYGAGPRQLFDVYSCGDAAAPVLFYIHGGYWQRGTKNIYGFVAQPFVAQGCNVVVVGYDLCPDVSITRISEEMREALAYIWHNADALGLNRNRVTVMGHSAGGHLTEMMMGTDWTAFDPDMPADFVKAGIPLSPLSLLEPVRRTNGLNSGIRMDEAEAERESPMLNHPPLTNAPQMVVFGGGETSEFHRQARMYSEKFATADRQVDLLMVPQVDHFDLLNVLVDPSSEFFARVCALLKGQ